MTVMDSPVASGAISDRTLATDKEKIVVLGSGWAAIKFVQNIDTDVFDVTIVSPRNFFLFTPFLPSVTVGSVEGRSIVEPVRALVQYQSRPLLRKLKDRNKGRDGLTEEGFTQARFLEVACTEINPDDKTILCEDISSVAFADEPAFKLSYDKLVIAVGATNNDFNTPGVKEHAVFLKEIEDTGVIRSRLLDAFETASLVYDEQKKRELLEIVVVGAGPTGIEFAAELDDLIVEDLSKLYPDEAKLAQVVVVSSSDDLLSSYDKRISDFTGKVLQQSPNLKIESGIRVTEVKENGVVCKRKSTGEVFELPSALTLWSTGVKPIPVIQELIDATPEQTKKQGIFVDGTLKAFGLDGVYALGDCSTVYEKQDDVMEDELVSLFSKADKDNSDTVNREELFTLFDVVSSKYPQAGVFKAKVEDSCPKQELGKEEFAGLLKEVDSTLRTLPPTAQVAGQQGSYLAALLNAETSTPFEYFHKGSMAYIGSGKAAAQVSMLKSLLPTKLQGVPLIGEDIVLTGSLAEVVWKFLYLDMQISNRNKLQVAFDWVKSGIFGRDTSRY